MSLKMCMACLSCRSRAKARAAQISTTGKQEQVPKEAEAERKEPHSKVSTTGSLSPSFTESHYQQRTPTALQLCAEPLRRLADLSSIEPVARRRRSSQVLVSTPSHFSLFGTSELEYKCHKDAFCHYREGQGFSLSETLSGAWCLDNYSLESYFHSVSDCSDLRELFDRLKISDSCETLETLRRFAVVFIKNKRTKKNAIGCVVRNHKGWYFVLTTDSMVSQAGHVADAESEYEICYSTGQPANLIATDRARKPYGIGILRILPQIHSQVQFSEIWPGKLCELPTVTMVHQLETGRPQTTVLPQPTGLLSTCSEPCQAGSPLFVTNYVTQRDEIYGLVGFTTDGVSTTVPSYTIRRWIDCYAVSPRIAPEKWHQVR